MTRQQPWEGKSAMAILTALMIRGERLPMPGPPPASSPLSKDATHAATRRGLATLVGKCWHTETAKRPTFLKVVHTLEALERARARAHPSLPTSLPEAKIEVEHEAESPAG
jgi:hypothetical protein